MARASRVETITQSQLSARVKNTVTPRPMSAPPVMVTPIWPMVIAAMKNAIGGAITATARSPVRTVNAANALEISRASPVTQT